MLWFCSSFMCQTAFEEITSNMLPGQNVLKHVKDPIFIVDRICKGSYLFIIVDDSSALSCFYC